MGEDLLLLHDVVKDYGSGDTAVRVLHGINLTLKAGEFAALVGPSGCGKTTLLNLMGLLDTPTGGTLQLTGVETTTLKDAQRTELRGKALGFIFQFHHLLPAFSALENVIMPLLVDSGRPSKATRELGTSLLAAVGLEKFADRNARQLSGGQQQRVAIARALARHPPLVLADEPTGNLDTQASAQAFDLMRQLNREQGAAFLVVTHDQRIAARCDRIIEMLDGRVVRDGPVGQGIALPVA
jgi:lipoprotein-releasing system ATP-binding protein